LPYFFESNTALIEQGNIPVSRTVFILSIVIQSAIFLTVAVWIGSYFVKRTGINVFTSPSRKVILTSSLIGIATGISILIFDYFFHINKVTPNFFTVSIISSWKTLLVCFYGGIVEEILLRLFLLSLFLFLFQKMFKGKHNNVAIATATIITAIVFAIGHIPAMQMQTALNSAIVTRIIILNTMGGVVFGYVYIRRGLIPAMVAHFSADFMLIFLFPILYF